MTPGLRAPLISSLLGDAWSNVCFIFVDLTKHQVKLTKHRGIYSKMAVCKKKNRKSLYFHSFSKFPTKGVSLNIPN